jgi:hypothetical protein
MANAGFRKRKREGAKPRRREGNFYMDGQDEQDGGEKGTTTDQHRPTQIRNWVISVGAGIAHARAPSRELEGGF